MAFERAFKAIAGLGMAGLASTALVTEARAGDEHPELGQDKAIASCHWGHAARAVTVFTQNGNVITLAVEDRNTVFIDAVMDKGDYRVSGQYYMIPQNLYDSSTISNGHLNLFVPPEVRGDFGLWNALTNYPLFYNGPTALEDDSYPSFAGNNRSHLPPLPCQELDYFKKGSNRPHFVPYVGENSPGF
ncbi:MAG: hypothetical protein P4M15_13690 [Alphaproteobacteria bacterium]|nr:hypothetical protein [Alphaproteobacteria bacterium]